MDKLLAGDGRELVLTYINPFEDWERSEYVKRQSVNAIPDDEKKL